MKSKDILLIIPPYGDFTYPYHSVSYLIPYLKASGYKVDVIDLNIEWFHHIFNRKQILFWKTSFLTKLDMFEFKPSWTLHDQEEVLKLIQSISICDTLDPEETIRSFQSQCFYDYTTYLKARHQIRQFERLISYVYPSFDFYNTFRNPPYVQNAESIVKKSFASYTFIKDVCEILRARFEHKSYLFCGISIPFTGQIQLGFASLAAVRIVFPTVKRLAGGTAISDIYKNRVSMKTLSPFRLLCEHFLVGEGDETISQYADWCLGKRVDLPNQIINLRDLERDNCLSPRKYVNIHRKPFFPDYSWVRWDLYLSPEKQVNYSPSRGCYWSRCAFCDYGLNESSPSAPYREIEVKIVIDHLKQIRKNGVRYVYFAVDTISPVFLKRLTNLLISEDVSIFWSTEFCIEKIFTKKIVAELAKSSLVTCSFGLESGSERVLSLMEKGHKKKDILQVLDAFRTSTIAIQPKFFLGFPGETEQERQDTVDLLNQNRDVFSIITDWNVFVLTPGSKVAKNPEKYGVTNIRRKPGDTIGGGLDYRLKGKVNVPAPKPSSFAYFNKQLDYFHTFERPFVGGIDTFHSTLYINKFGKNVFYEIQKKFSKLDELTRPWNAIHIESHFNLEDVFDNVLIANASKSVNIYNALEEIIGKKELKKIMKEIPTPLKRNKKSKYNLKFCLYE